MSRVESNIKREDRDYGDWQQVFEHYWNIQITDNPDDLPTPDYSIYPVAIKHNWDWSDYASVPLLTDSECDTILAEWDDNPEKTIKEDLNYRKCNINWIHYYKPGWESIFEKINNAVNKVNKNIFKFDLSNPITQEPIQFTKYTKHGHYDEHEDWRGGSIQDARKLSYVINLSNTKDYRGGHLQIKNTKMPKDRGMIHFFPSFMRHQATKVLKGTRYSLVGWVTGPPFK